MSQDFNQRISIIINHTLPSWQVLNTVAHISAYFGNILGAQFGTGPYFKTQDDVNYPRNSQYPIIALSAAPDQLPNFAALVRTRPDVRAMYFIREMIETNNDAEIVETLANKTAAEIEFLGVGIFGSNQVVKSLTQTFKLWS